VNNVTSKISYLTASEYFQLFYLFTKHNNMSVLSEFWGKGCWDLLYSIAYSSTDIKKTIEFLIVLSDVLPCEDCREHYKEYLEKNPINLESDIKIWLNGLQNSINVRLGKKEISLDEIKQRIEKYIIVKPYVPIIKAENVVEQVIAPAAVAPAPVEVPVVTPVEVVEIPPVEVPAPVEVVDVPVVAEVSPPVEVPVVTSVEVPVVAVVTPVEVPVITEVVPAVTVSPPVEVPVTSPVEVPVTSPVEVPVVVSPPTPVEVPTPPVVPPVSVSSASPPMLNNIASVSSRSQSVANSHIIYRISPKNSRGGSKKSPTSSPKNSSKEFEPEVIVAPKAPEPVAPPVVVAPKAPEPVAPPAPPPAPKAPAKKGCGCGR
jgi:hypothetical protein